ncbi:MAG TPA: CapA family protein [Lutibacter sp.]|nr:CapA family protein [Lutibacter sp.]
MIKHWILFSFSLFFFHSFYAQEETENTLKLLFLGDIMGHGPQIKAAYNSTSKTYNYENNFQYMQPIFAKADYTIANLEVTLGTKPYSGYPQFSSPIELAIAAQNAGIDILATANNHSCDRRKKGIVKTIEVLDSLHISHFGTYTSPEEKAVNLPLLIEKNNIRVALLNYTYGTNGIAIPKGTVVNLLDKETIENDVLIAKAYQPDQIIAFVHWGQQYKNLASASQKKWFNYFKSLGVNIVIGSHPHVVEPMEWDKTQNSLVVYSLGNFVSNQRTFPRDGGAVFELVLSKKETKTTIKSAQYLLTWVYKQTNKNKDAYFVLPVDEYLYKKPFFDKPSDFNKMHKYAKHTRKLLNKNNLNITEKKPFTEFAYRLLYSIM